MAHFARPAQVPRESRGVSEPFGRQPELGLPGRRSRSRESRLWFRQLRSLKSGWRPNGSDSPLDSRGT